MTVTVITSTIGRPELRQCIESVRAQTYKGNIRHMIFVNGEKFHEDARAVLKNYSNSFIEAGWTHVTPIYLPEETGDYGMGGSMADVFAAAPFLTRADWIFYLDDDNFYEPNHIESVMSLVKEHKLQWAYSLRNIVDKRGAYICADDWCSLGHWPVFGTDQHLVDNSCYAVSRRLAQRYALAWTALPFVADRCFCMALMESKAKYGCTGLSTVNYRTGTGTALNEPSFYRGLAERIRYELPNGFPWRKASVFKR